MDEVPVSQKKLKLSSSSKAHEYHHTNLSDIFRELNRERTVADSFCDINVKSESFQLSAHKCVLWASGCFKSVSALDSVVESFPKFDKKLCEAFLALVKVIYRLHTRYIDDCDKEKIRNDLSELNSYLDVDTIEGLFLSQNDESLKMRLHQVLEHLNNDRHVSSASFCDATINCGNEQFCVHKCIASTASDFFKTLFSTELNKVDESIYKVQATDSEQVKLALDFIYSSVLTLNEDNIYELIACSDYFLLPKMKRLCCNFLWRCINKESLFEIFACADFYNLESVLEVVAEYFHFNSWEISDEGEYKALDKEALARLLKIDCYHKCEELMFIAILRWLKHDIDERQNFISYLTHLLDYKRFSMKSLDTLLPAEFHSDPVTKLMLQCLQQKINEEKCDHKLLYFVTNFPSTSDFLTHDTVVWKYDLLTDKWSSVGSCDNPQIEKINLPNIGYKNELASVFLDAWYYVIGINGRLGFKLSVTDTQLHWEEIAPFPKYRSTKSAAVLNGKIYVSGGMSSEEEPLASCLCYNPTTNLWDEISPMLSRRSFHFMLATDSSLYVTSGTNITGVFDILLQMSGVYRDRGLSTDCYNPQSKEWTRQLPPNPSTGEVEPDDPEEYESIVEKASVVVAFKNCLYYVENGEGMFWSKMATMWKYCISTNEWSYVFVPFEISVVYNLFPGDKLYAMCQDIHRQLCLYECEGEDGSWSLLSVVASKSSLLNCLMRFANAVVLPAPKENLAASL